ncbi:hypothetical protein Slala02_50480 [Streptomyces lavendulae subsp. lavendulae]|nr:hypothetical protein Slala02_50480 [Streptomyces lavendulae subsp. lavendulae]
MSMREERRADMVVFSKRTWRPGASGPGKVRVARAGAAGRPGRGRKGWGAHRGAGGTAALQEQRSCGRAGTVAEEVVRYVSWGSGGPSSSGGPRRSR